MNIEHIILCLLGILLVGSPSVQAGESSLSRLVDEALLNNPELAVAEARWQQYRFNVPQAKSLDDPVLSFTFSNYPTDSFSSDEFPMTGNEFRLAQKFPYPGKLEAREDRAEEEASWYRAVYLDGRYQLAGRVKDAWYRLYFQDKAIAVVERNLGLMDKVIRMTEVRYELGNGLQQDVLKAHVERSRLLDRLIQLRQNRAVVLADLNTLLNRPTDSPIDTPNEISWVEMDTSLATLQSAAETQRPLYDAYRSLTKRFEAERRLADLNYKPDVTLWAGYRFRDDDLPDDGTDFVSAGISINLPIYQDKRDAAVAEAGAGLRTARMQFEDFRGKVRYKISEAYTRMAESQEQALLYRDGLVPQATQSFNAAMSAYQVGNVEFMSLLDSLIKLNSLEMDHFLYQSNYLRNLALLEAESGVTLLGYALPKAEDVQPF